MYILLNLNHTYFGGAKKGESCKIILPFWLHYGNLPCLSLTATYGAQQRKGNVLLCFHWGGGKKIRERATLLYVRAKTIEHVRHG